MPPRRSAAQPPKLKGTTPSVATYFGGSAAPAEPAVSSLSVAAPAKGSKPIQCQCYDPSAAAGTSPPALVFTHGAGGGMSNAATADFAAGFAAGASQPVLVFEGASNLTSRTKAFSAVLAHVQSECAPEDAPAALALGGRSMGARAAVAAATAALEPASPAAPQPAALVLVSYPLRGPSGDVRDAILLALPAGVDVLFVSGDRDGMCDLAQLRGVRARMAARSWLAVVRGADHGMATRPASALQARRRASGRVAAAWLADRDPGRTECVLTGVEEAGEWAAPEPATEGSGKGKKRAAAGEEEVPKRARKR